MIFLILAYLLAGVIWFVRILAFMIIANALLSWFLDPSHPVRQLLLKFVGPVLRPIRLITDKLTANSSLPIDISPILAYFALMIIIQVLNEIHNFLRLRAFIF